MKSGLMKRLKFLKANNLVRHFRNNPIQKTLILFKGNRNAGKGEVNNRETDEKSFQNRKSPKRDQIKKT